MIYETPYILKIHPGFVIHLDCATHLQPALPEHKGESHLQATIRSLNKTARVTCHT